MADSGISTLGVKLYAKETADGTKVESYGESDLLTRINAIGEVTVEPESIDSSALEDFETQYVQGRSTVSDTFAVTVNATNETVAEWKKILNKKVCFMTVVPGLTEAFFVIATVPSIIPEPAIDQNGLLTFTMNCTANKYIGMDEKASVGE